jgi:dephospho-CoA kinase
MLRVGLTGNIGSGKSTVARVWESMGARVLSADAIAKDLLAPGSALLGKVVRAFGEGILDSEGALDRKRLAGVVFRDGRALAALDAIVHPAVIRRIREIIEKDDAGSATIYVVEAALIIECGRETDYDVIVVVESDRAECVERVMRERGLAREDVERIARAQMAPEEKRKKAQIVIENDGSIEDLVEKARRVFEELIRMERKEERA